MCAYFIIEVINVINLKQILVIFMVIHKIQMIMTSYRVSLF